jgi:hypothetical protein
MQEQWSLEDVYATPTPPNYYYLVPSRIIFNAIYHRHVTV